MSEALGEKIVAELAARKLRGLYFSFDEYKQIRTVSTVEELAAFLAAADHADVAADPDAARFVDNLQQASKRGFGMECAFILGDVFLFGLPRLITAAIGRARVEQSNCGQTNAE